MRSYLPPLPTTQQMSVSQPMNSHHENQQIQVESPGEAHNRDSDLILSSLSQRTSTFQEGCHRHPEMIGNEDDGLVNPGQTQTSWDQRDGKMFGPPPTNTDSNSRSPFTLPSAR